MAASLTVCITFKPNCELENIRAALIVRRVRRLCDQVTAYPPMVRSDARTIGYLRDHGLFLEFTAPAPDMVLLSIRSSFFVETCTLMEDADTVPAYKPDSDSPSAFLDEEADTNLALLSTRLLQETDRDEELFLLAARFEQVRNALRVCAQRHDKDRALEAALFEQERLTESLRMLVSHLRTKPFSAIAPSLAEHARVRATRFKADIRLTVKEDRTELDRLVLATLEDMAKRLINLIIRYGVDEPDARRASGKPAQVSIRLELENEGSHVTLNCTHDGVLFNPRELPATHMLMQPVEEYSDEELGRLVFLPRFAGERDDRASSTPDVNVIGTTLDRLNGSGTVCNLPDGMVRLALRLPVDYTVCNVALVNIAGTRCAIPAASIVRFEAYREENRRQGACDAYLCQDGKEHMIANGEDALVPMKAEAPRFVATLDEQAGNLTLAVDSVDGYAQAVVRPLPPLMLHHMQEADLHLGWSDIANDTVRTILNPQRLGDRLRRKEGVHGA